MTTMTTPAPTPSRDRERAMDEDLAKCESCGERVLTVEICEQHGVCLWCDTDCKLAFGEDEDANR